jgi:hypothetical protein
VLRTLTSFSHSLSSLQAAPLLSPLLLGLVHHKVLQHPKVFHQRCWQCFSRDNLRKPRERLVLI